MEEQDQDTLAMQGMQDYYAELADLSKEMKRSNDRLLRVIKNMFGQNVCLDIEECIDDCEGASAKLTLVRRPEGEYQEESYGEGAVEGVWVDQYSGPSGDDFSGNVYVELKRDKFLCIPYEM